MAHTLAEAARANFLGNSPVWYKWTIIGFLVLNPILVFADLHFIAGWVLDKSNPDVTVEALQAGTGVYDYTVTMLTFAGFGLFAVFFAIRLKIADRGPDSHGLELPSGEAAALNRARHAENAA